MMQWCFVSLPDRAMRPSLCGGIRNWERERFALARIPVFPYPGTLVTRPRFNRTGTQHLKPWPTRTSCRVPGSGQIRGGRRVAS